MIYCGHQKLEEKDSGMEDVMAKNMKSKIVNTA